MTDPYRLADVMPPGQTRQRRSATPWIVTAVIAVLVAVGVGAYALMRDDGPTAGAPAASTVADTPTASAPAPAEAGPPRVADLMDRLGCDDAAVIGTQLYSRETGRCKAAAGEITIAAFDTAQLRDQWVEFARQYGGSTVVGDRWALIAESPDDAAAAATALAGQRL